MIRIESRGASVGPDLMDHLVHRYKPKGTPCVVSRLRCATGVTQADMSKLARINDRANPFDLRCSTRSSTVVQMRSYCNKGQAHWQDTTNRSAG